MIISTVNAEGGPVKLLGIDFDNKMAMSIAAHKCATSAGLKTRALLWAQRYYSTKDMLLLYKSHVLSLIEYRTPGLRFASTCYLNSIDNLQVGFFAPDRNVGGRCIHTLQLGPTFRATGYRNFGMHPQSVAETRPTWIVEVLSQMSQSTHVHRSPPPTPQLSNQ